jgi:hypothetical protein
MRVTSYFNGEVWMTGEVIAFLPDRTAVVKNDANGFLSTLDINSLKIVENDTQLDKLKSFLREIKNELSPFTHEDAILDVNVRIREILGE